VTGTRHKRTNTVRLHVQKVLRIGKFIETESSVEVTVYYYIERTEG
jgi:hypothetical protein